MALTYHQQCQRNALESSRTLLLPFVVEQVNHRHELLLIGAKSLCPWNVSRKYTIFGNSLFFVL